MLLNNCNDEFNPCGITIDDNCQSCMKTKSEVNGAKRKYIIDN